MANYKDFITLLQNHRILMVTLAVICIILVKKGKLTMQNFNYHTHTYRCGHADMDYLEEDYIKDFIKMGFKKMAFTDHAPEKNEIDRRPEIRMKYDERIEYLQSIKELKEKYKGQIEILSGYEVEYLPGEEENLKELKNETDKLILGQHFIYNKNGNLKIFSSSKEEIFTEEELIKYAQYIEEAMKNNIPDIIAHPDLFMLNSEKFGEKEEKISHMICKSAEKYNIPLEINLNRVFKEINEKKIQTENDSIELQNNELSNISYPCKEFWNIATQYNIKVLYGLDVHHRGQITLYNNLIELSEKILGKEIINKLNFIIDSNF